MGELHPFVDEERCISCGKCVRTCPANVPPAFHYPMACYAAWNGNGSVRAKSASGGIGYALGEYVISQCGGTVFGAAWDKDFNARMSGAARLDAAEAFKGSKYVQALTGNAYIRVREELERGVPVLFAGTPCQTAGLLSFIGKAEERLFTVDLICHGVCPGKYLREEIASLRVPAPDDIRFRGNDGNDFRFTLWQGNKRVYARWAKEEYYFASFLGGLSLRENCYHCPYARPERVGDITIGDFIGLDKDFIRSHAASGASVVLVNTGKGRILYEKMLSSNPAMRSFPVDYSVRLKYAPSLREPFAKHPRREVFLRLYPRLGFARAARRVLWPELTWNKITGLLRRKVLGTLKRIIRHA